MKIVGMMVVGPRESERYLAKSLEELKRLCDDVIICCNNTDKATEQMIKSFGFKYYRDDSEWGINQPTIKENLVKKLSTLNPDWVVAIDSDEVFHPSLTREKLEDLTTKLQVAWYFYVINLWDDELHCQNDLNFWNIRFFKYPTDGNISFTKKRLHCGLAPEWAYFNGAYAPFILKHYGLMRSSDRGKKVERYNKYDPYANFKGQEYYDALKWSKSPQSFDQDEFQRKVEDEVKTYKLKSRNNSMKNEKEYVYIMREDGTVFDAPKSKLHLYMKMNDKWKVISEEVKKDLMNPTAMPEPVIVEDPLECGICGFIGTSEHSLKIHQSKAGHL